MSLSRRKFLAGMFGAPAAVKALIAGSAEAPVETATEFMRREEEFPLTGLHVVPRSSLKTRMGLLTLVQSVLDRNERAAYVAPSGVILIEKIGIRPKPTDDTHVLFTDRETGVDYLLRLSPGEIEQYEDIEFGPMVSRFDQAIDVVKKLVDALNGGFRESIIADDEWSAFYSRVEPLTPAQQRVFREMMAGLRD